MKSKQEALNRLDSIEKEAKELRQIIEDANKPKPIKERVYDIPSAIAELGEGDEAVKEYRKMQRAGLSSKNLRGQEIEIFCKAVNEKTIMDWENESQEKWYIWMDYRKKGSGFVRGFYYYCYYCGSISARHCYKSKDLAVHGSKCIENILREYYN